MGIQLDRRQWDGWEKDNAIPVSLYMTTYNVSRSLYCKNVHNWFAYSTRLRGTIYITCCSLHSPPLPLPNTCVHTHGYRHTQTINSYCMELQWPAVITPIALKAKAIIPLLSLFKAVHTRAPVHTRARTHTHTHTRVWLIWLQAWAALHRNKLLLFAKVKRIYAVLPDLPMHA